MVQLSHPYMTTGKIIALSMWTFAGKVMSLLFNMLSRFVIAFLPKSKCLLISCLQSPSAVILEPQRIKSIVIYIVSPSICHEMMGLDAIILFFWMLNLNFSMLLLVSECFVWLRRKSWPPTWPSWPVSKVFYFKYSFFLRHLEGH